MSGFSDRLSRLPADTRDALAFFSRLPIKRREASFDLRRNAGTWPLAGAILALGPAILFFILTKAWTPALAASFAALALFAALTGALHEDGLADTADGFGGGPARAQKLEIMRDSRIGAFGVLALLFTIGMKAGALAALSGRPAAAGLALVAAAALSRSMALWHWSATASARRDGLAHAAGRPDAAALAIGSAAGVLAAMLLLPAFGAAALLAIVIAGAATMAFSRLCRRQIGGHTGDTIGAAQQLAETVLLVGISTAASPFIA